MSAEKTAKAPRPSGLPRLAGSGKSTPTKWQSRESLASNASLSDLWVVGDRCYVNGSKPAKVAFIGETQFASGDWIGVVLDDTSGKNNGTVSGVRYFECPSNRGLFCRPAKLSKLPDTLGPLPQLTPRADLNNTTSRRDSHDDSLSVSSAGPLSPAAAPVDIPENTAKLCLGEHVIVSGTKRGILRYLGDTEFAKGVWAGVELSQAVGKNDGSVQGKRYFSCRPQYGLFAPIGKVVRDPQVAVGASAINLTSTGSRLKPLQRAGSNESLSSVVSASSMQSSASRRVRLGVAALSPAGQHQRLRATTPVGPTAQTEVGILQDSLREKEQHVEQLLRERDLERADMARQVQGQQDVEQQLAAARSEHSEMRLQLDYLHNTVSELESERKTLAEQLEDERKISEDLRFQLEEQKIAREDTEARLSTLEKQSVSSGSELQSGLSEAQEKATRLAKDLLLGQQKIRELEHKLEEKMNEEKVLREGLGKIEQQVEANSQSSKQRIADLERLIAEQDGYLKSRESEISALQASLTEKASATNSDTLEKAKLIQDIHRLKDCLRDSTTKLEAQVVADAQVQLRCQELDAKLNGALQDVRTREDLCTQLRNEKQQLETQLAEKAGATADQLNFLQQKDSEILALQQRLASEQALLSEQQREVDALKHTEQSLRDEQRKKDDLCNQLRVEKQALEQQLAEKSGATADQLNLLHQKESEILALQQRLATEQALLTEQRREVDSLKHTEQSLRDEQRKKDDQCNQLRVEKQALEQQLAEKSGATADQLNLLQQKESEILALQQRLASEQVLLTEQRREVDNLKHTEQSLKVEQQKKDDQCNQLRMEKQTLEQQLAEKSGATAEQLNLLQQKDSEIATLQQQLAAEEAQLVEHRRELDLLRKSEVVLKEQQQAKDGALGDLQSRLQTAESQVHQLSSVLEKSQNDLQVLASVQSQNDVLQREISSLKEAHALAAEDIVRKLTADADQLRAEVDQLRPLKDQISELSAERQRLFDEYTSVVSAAKTETDRQSAEKEQLATEVRSLQAKLTEHEHLTSAKVGEVSKQKDEASKAIMELTTQNQQLAVENKRQTDELSAAENKLTDLEKVHAEKAERTAQELLAMRQKIETLMQNVALKENETQNLCSEKAALTEQLSSLQAKLSHLETNASQSRSLANGELAAEKERHKQLQKEIEMMKQEAEEQRKRQLIDIASLESEKNDLREEVRRREKALEEKESLLIDLHRQSSALDVASLARMEQLETEKFELQEKLAELETALQQTAATPQVNNGVVNGDATSAQVDFLNSVIVGQKRTIDELRMKIDVLQTNSIDLGHSFKNVPKPRLYCDICEEFDLHDTDDCPTQQSEMAEEETHTKSHGKRGGTREYCDKCEEFGHDTQHCTVDEDTF